MVQEIWEKDQVVIVAEVDFKGAANVRRRSGRGEAAPHRMLRRGRAAAAEGGPAGTHGGDDVGEAFLQMIEEQEFRSAASVGGRIFIPENGG